MHEASSQLASEGFVTLDGFCGAECTGLREQVDELLARHAGRDRIGNAATSGAGGASQGSSALNRLRGDLTVWADEATDGTLSLGPLLHRIGSLTAGFGAPGQPTEIEARDIDRR